MKFNVLSKENLQEINSERSKKILGKGMETNFHVCTYLPWTACKCDCSFCIQLLLSVFCFFFINNQLDFFFLHKYILSYLKQQKKKKKNRIK